MLTHYEVITILLSVVTALLIPAVVIMIRGAIKWTRMEDKLGNAVDNIGRLVLDKDKVHAEIAEQMRFDRDATNRRLERLEEIWIRRSVRGRG